MHVVIILDKSGSMGHTTDDTKGSLNGLANEYPDATFSLIEFGYDITVSVEQGMGGDLKKAIENYRPSGGTPLYDGIGKAFDSVVTLDSGKEMIAIITDGQENQSRLWKKEQIKTLLTLAQRAGVGVLFLGANMDAFAEASSLGLARESTLSYMDTASLSVPTSQVNVGAVLRQSVATYAATGSVNTTSLQALQAKEAEENKTP
jgi:Mg-chelatase subunit ChlD